ncbi:peptidylprolyl isomerase [Buchnera aphidicola (Aphis glycines)]|uniref:Periplasmic chaperone PpiD n=1 Tax=Buchnera aphidicola (Aphis glycines) TaxID=1265350 RepID=A0A0M4H4S8_9GAMM|nr:SurA N-terminal domain-containing protein [Buchnera aphidicola]ALD15405.1 peptidylprolyl isomerase [Buchnera aphidicola (Aphis glycines)]
MMQFFKTRSKRIVIQCILGIIILSIIFGTLNNYIHKDTKKYVAEVNQEKISFETIQNMFNIELNKNKKILKKNLNLVDKKTLKQKIYNYVLSQLINNILLEQYAKNIEFHLSNNAVKKVIFNSDIFQENNKFNNKKYLNYLQSLNLTNNEYIELIKKKLNTINLINTIAETDFILDSEKKNTLNLLTQKRTIKKAIFKIHSIQNQNVNNIEILNYFKKNKNKFYDPEKFKISYIHIEPKQFNIKCNNEEIKNWYQKNLKKYTTQEKRNYSIIQIKTKKEALLILSRLKKGENFEKIAKENSIDPISSKKGGNIGWITINSMPEEIKKSNLNTINQISNIIKFNHEFLIIKLNNILVKQTKKISEVFNIITSEIKQKKALSIYYNLKNKILLLSKTHKDRFDLIEKKINIKSIETPWFDKYSIPKILTNTTLKKIIFTQGLLDREKKMRSHSGLIELKNNQLFLLTINNFKEKKLKNFQAVKKNIIKILKYSKAVKETKKAIKQVLFNLNHGNQDILRKKNIVFNHSEIFSRYDDNPIVDKIFSIPYKNNEKKIYIMYQDKNKNFIIAFISKVYNEKFSNNEEEMIIKYLEKNNIEKIFNCIIKNLHKKSKIIYNQIKNI